MEHSPALRQILESARARASAAGHPKVTVYHLLAAILADPAAQELIAQSGGSASKLSTLASEKLQHVEEPSFWEGVVSRLIGPAGIAEAPSFRRPIGWASRQMRRASKTDVGVGDILAALFRDLEMADMMRESGLTRLAVLRYHCHGLRPSGQGDPEMLLAGQCEVVILNDDYTEMHTVIQILERAFDMKPARAFRTMMKVHATGLGAVGPYPADEAARRMRWANQMAAAAESPLRLQARAFLG
jgi:ATP-dependent Clp protease adapter protein ClpS